MVDLIRDLITEAGGTLGLYGLVLSILIAFLFYRLQRVSARQAGLLMLLVDLKIVSNSQLLQYGAVDDPRRVASLKEVLS